jgi:hypothetical protein
VPSQPQRCRAIPVRSTERQTLSTNASDRANALADRQDRQLTFYRTCRIWSYAQHPFAIDLLDCPEQLFQCNQKADGSNVFCFGISGEFAGEAPSGQTRPGKLDFPNSDLSGVRAFNILKACFWRAGVSVFLNRLRLPANCLSNVASWTASSVVSAAQWAIEKMAVWWPLAMDIQSAS